MIIQLTLHFDTDENLAPIMILALTSARRAFLMGDLMRTLIEFPVYKPAAFEPTISTHDFAISQ